LNRRFQFQQLVRDHPRVCTLLLLGTEVNEDGPFVGTAAVLKALDLVVSADTAVGHLAGALEVKVGVALAAVSDWRWLRGREDTVWYPSMRLFRQQELGDWDGVFAQMAGELRGLVKGGLAKESRENVPGQLTAVGVDDLAEYQRRSSASAEGYDAGPSTR
jgi:hypothetical protein